MKSYVVGQVPSGYAPLPPENVLINGARYPADISGQYTTSWAPNPREHVHGPAVSGDETYTLRLYGESDTLIRTVTGITGNSYTWSTEVADSGLVGDYNSVVNADSPVAYWKLDETSGTTATDSVGGLTGAYAGATLNQTPLIATGTSVLFSGAGGSGIGIPDNSALSFVNTGFSFDLWVKTSTGASSVLLAKDDADSPAEYELILNADGTLTCVVRSSASDTPKVTANTTLAVNDNVRHHIACVFTQSGTLKIYVDSVERGSTAHSLSSSYNSSYALRIGRRDGAGYFAGAMDEAAFYASALSPARIASHYNALVRYNSSIRAELETVRGGVTSYQKQIIKSTRSVTAL